MTLPGRGGGGKWAPGGGGDWNPESVGEGAFGKGEVIAACSSAASAKAPSAPTCRCPGC